MWFHHGIATKSAFPLLNVLLEARMAIVPPGRSVVEDGVEYETAETPLEDRLLSLSQLQADFASRGTPL
jgi:hypothetical protein